MADGTFFIGGLSHLKKLLWHKINILCILFCKPPRKEKKKKKKERAFMRAINMPLLISGCCIHLCSICVLELYCFTQTETAHCFSAQLEKYTKVSVPSMWRLRSRLAHLCDLWEVEHLHPGFPLLSDQVIHQAPYNEWTCSLHRS